MSIQITGLGYPLELTSGKHTLVSGVDLIKTSIIIIVMWPLRTRYFNGFFGSRIYEAIEEPNDGILLNLIRRFIIDSISQWEKRVELISVDVDKPSPEKLVINLTYRVKESNIIDNLNYTI